MQTPSHDLGVLCGQQADAMCCTLAIAIFAYLGFAQPHALASHAPLAYALTMCAMLALLAAAWVVPRICSPQALWWVSLGSFRFVRVSRVPA